MAVVALEQTLSICTYLNVPFLREKKKTNPEEDLALEMVV